MPSTIPYVEDDNPLHTLDLYNQSSSGLWVVFIHGGAWYATARSRLRAGETLNKLHAMVNHF
jgi:hypothetical protein